MPDDRCRMIIGARINADLHLDPAPPLAPAPPRRTQRNRALQSSPASGFPMSQRQTPGAGNFCRWKTGCAPSPGAANFGPVTLERKARTAKHFPSLTPESPLRRSRVVPNARPVAESGGQRAVRALSNRVRRGGLRTQRNRVSSPSSGPLLPLPGADPAWHRPNGRSAPPLTLDFARHLPRPGGRATRCGPLPGLYHNANIRLAVDPGCGVSAPRCAGPSSRPATAEAGLDGLPR